MATKRESILKSLARLVGALCCFLFAGMLLFEHSLASLACLFAGFHVLYGDEAGPPQRGGTSRSKSVGTRSGSGFARSNGAHGQREPLRSGTEHVGLLDDDDYSSAPAINPATGLAMVGGLTYGVDVGGSVYGTTSASPDPDYSYQDYSDYSCDTGSDYSCSTFD